MFIEITVQISNTSNYDDAMALASNLREVVAEAIDSNDPRFTELKDLLDGDAPIGYSVEAG